MKKNFWLVFLVLTTMVFAFAESGVITSPATGANWVKNTSETITWNLFGDQAANVKIQLFKGKSKVMDIALETENDGTYDWIIPKTLKSGVYKIQITALDTEVKSNNFIIVDGLIQITQPVAGDKWINGTTQNITWTSKGAVHEKVKIQLYDGTAKVLDIATKAPTASGKFAWKIPITLAPSSAYSVQVITRDNSVGDKSGLFALPAGKIPITPPSLEIEIWKGIWSVKQVMAFIDSEQQWQASGEENFGIALRYKHRSSFSLGVSYQKFQGQYFCSRAKTEEFDSPRYLRDFASREVYALKMVSSESEKIDFAGGMAIVDFRWEIIPARRIHPYFTIGIGALFLSKITDEYHCIASGIDWEGKEFNLGDDDMNSLDVDDVVPKILPVLELMFGLKIELLKKHLTIGVEGGLLDGIVYRGTLNFRF